MPPRAVKTFAQKPPPYARVLPQVVCPGVNELRVELDRVNQLGGEGLMLRQPGSKRSAVRQAT